MPTPTKYLCPRVYRTPKSGHEVYVVAPDAEDARELLRCGHCFIREGSLADNTPNVCHGPIDAGEV